MGLLGAGFFVYLGSQWLFVSNAPTSRVANAPPGLQSVPGGKQTPEFSKAVEQANLQRTKQAEVTGESAVPTLINIGQPGLTQASTAPCVICTEQPTNVKNSLDEWVKQGKVAPDTAKLLTDLAGSNVPVSTFADQLGAQVKAGKLTPAQARDLLLQYTKQFANAALQEGAKLMDALIKAGQLLLEDANHLLMLQKNRVPVSDYAAALQEMAKAGNISPATEQQLLAQYTKQRAREAMLQGLAALHQLALKGAITPEAEKELADLESRSVPLDFYTAAVQRMVTLGKLTPAVAAQLVERYAAEKAGGGPVGSIARLIKNAEAAAEKAIDDAVQAGQMTGDTATQLKTQIEGQVPLPAYQTGLDQFVQQRKLLPPVANARLGDYQKVTGLRDVAQRLAALQASNAPAARYIDELKRAVAAGLLTPDDAAQLLREYQAATANEPFPNEIATGPGTAGIARLQQHIQQAAGQAPVIGAQQFVTPQTEETPQQQQLQAMVSAMSSQAQQLITAWQPTPMVNKEGSAESTTKNGMANGAPGASESSSTSISTTTTKTGRPLVKAGSILFAVLDTEANSDYPDSPIMATIVEGKFKGAKLLGKLVTTKSVSGQLDRISLSFSIMNMDQWDNTKAITAYAIDPDTAHTVLASQVDYHYLQRFGAIMATSFMQGYANTLLQSGGTSTTGIFGTSTTSPALSPASKIAAGFGQVGQNLSSVTKNYTNIPPTVKVDSGVGLGILFMKDLT